MNRALAIVEREMRKFFRSPALMLVAMVFPLVQLIVLGNAFGGKIRDARLGVVDEDGGAQALKVREAFDSVRSNMRTFQPIYYDNEKQATDDVRNGKIEGAVIIPPQFSRRVYEQDEPRISLVVDNSDNFMSSTLEGELSDLTNALNNPAIEPRVLQQTALQVVELYPYIEYMKYLLPGLDHFGDVRFGDDRRRHALHRRQGARRARGVPGHPHHQGGTCIRAERRGRDQGGDDRDRDHGHRVPVVGRGHAVQPRPPLSDCWS